MNNPTFKKGKKTRTKKRKLRRNRKNKQKQKKRNKAREWERGKEKKNSLDIALPRILWCALQCCPLFCPENRSKNRDIVPGLAQYPPEWNAFQRTAHYHRHARWNKLTSDKAAGPDNPRTSRWISLRIRLKNNVTPYVAADGTVNHEFSIGQRHSRRSAIIKLPSLVRKLLLITRVWLSLPFRRSAPLNRTDFPLFLKL